MSAEIRTLTRPEETRPLNMSAKKDKPQKRYDIVAGRDWWSVVEHDDDGCKGGDAHWVARELAEAARDAYVSGALVHGSADTQAVVALAKARGLAPGR